MHTNMTNWIPFLLLLGLCLWWAIEIALVAELIASGL